MLCNYTKFSWKENEIVKNLCCGSVVNLWFGGQIIIEVDIISGYFELDKQFASVERNIILSIDHCPIHSWDPQPKLKFRKLACFLSNITSKLQPLD